MCLWSLEVGITGKHHHSLLLTWVWSRGRWMSWVPCCLSLRSKICPKIRGLSWDTWDSVSKGFRECGIMEDVLQRLKTSKQDNGGPLCSSFVLGNFQSSLQHLHLNDGWNTPCCFNNSSSWFSSILPTPVSFIPRLLLSEFHSLQREHFSSIGLWLP